MCGKATARAKEPPRLSDHNERRTFTMAIQTVNQYTHGLTIDDADVLSEAAQKLHALLIHTYGNSGEAFRNMNDSLQDAYLWTCADLASQVEGLAKRLARAS